MDINTKLLIQRVRINPAGTHLLLQELYQKLEKKKIFENVKKKQKIEENLRETTKFFDVFEKKYALYAFKIEIMLFMLFAHNYAFYAIYAKI